MYLIPYIMCYYGLIILCFHLEVNVVGQLALSICLGFSRDQCDEECRSHLDKYTAKPHLLCLVVQNRFKDGKQKIEERVDRLRAVV